MLAQAEAPSATTGSAGRWGVAEADRSSRVFHSADLAERGGRVFSRPAAPERQVASAKGPGRAGARSRGPLLQSVAYAPETATPPSTALLNARLTAGGSEKAVAAASLFAKIVPTPSDPPQAKEAVQVASLDPRPGLGADASSDEVAPLAMLPTDGNVPVPSFRSSISSEIQAEVAEPAENRPSEPDSLPPGPSAVAVPSERPEAPPQRPVRVASLEPQDVAPPRSVPQPNAVAAIEAPRPEKRPVQKPTPVVAYARPDAGAAAAPQDSGQSGIGSFFHRLFHANGGSSSLPGPGSRVAVYDISSATVYLPGDGRLEAHSGLGQMQDNPRYVNQKNRGPTPPNIYNLVLRESRFHGAEAIRLLPADGRKKFNRDGLLAHPYMYIGPGNDRSQSNGCVVFKNYARFLQAFKQGRVKQMIVVKTLDDLPTYMAAL
ncbi:tlde1 domain-containing protein [Jiella sp. M17.18]|uniref:DUF2778 domain-containing protein n=1 Tax=Jiella sp. M17.18 TaxID=3234247 RepID=UPI0034DEEB21